MPARLLLSFSVEFRSVRDTLNAGNSPNRIPVAHDTASVKPSTRQSTPTAAPSSPIRGSPAGLIASSAPHSQESKREPQNPADHRQQNALRQQLPDHPCPARSQCRANRKFALASRRSHQQQVGHVGAGNQQHQAHRSQQNQQRRPRIPHNRIPQRLNRESSFADPPPETGAEIRHTPASSARWPAPPSRRVSASRLPERNVPGSCCSAQTGTESRCPPPDRSRNLAPARRQSCTAHRPAKAPAQRPSDSRQTSAATSRSSAPPRGRRSASPPVA